jgi:hypothetical protein
MNSPCSKRRGIRTYNGIAGLSHEDILIVSEIQEGAKGHAVTKLTEI